MMKDRDNYEYLDIRDEIGKKISWLQEFSDMEGTEVGEYIRILCAMWNYAPSYTGKPMYKQLVDEIDRMHHLSKTEYEVIEDKEQITRTRKFVELIDNLEES